mgnify:CR=1 FL=1
MKHILLAMSILVLCACGGSTNEEVIDTNNSPDDTKIFTLQNIRFDARDYYEGEEITVTKGTSFEVQWVAPTSESYRIDLHLSANGQEPSDNNKIVGLKCGNASLSLCPNATGEVQCEIDNNDLSCSIGSDFLGSENFLDKDLSSLKFMIKGCDALSHCDVKTFNLSIQNKTND